jgi:hypothetical protein
MKAKFVKDRLYEFNRSGSDSDSVKDTLKIGILKARCENVLRAFCEKGGHTFRINSAGNFIISCKIPGDKNRIEFKITFPNGMDSTYFYIRNAKNAVINTLSSSSGLGSLTSKLQGLINKAEKKNSKVSSKEELLIDSVRIGDTEKVRELLDMGANPNHKVASKIRSNIPLITAIDKGYEDIIRLLVEAGADVNASDKKGYLFPILTAINRGHSFEEEKDNIKFLRIVKFLIDNGADPFGKISPKTLFHYLNRSSSNIIEYLLKKYPGENFNRSDLSELFINAVKDGKAKVVKVLLDYGVDPYDKDRLGNNSFHYLERILKNPELYAPTFYHNEGGEYKEIENMLKKI